MSKKVLIIDDEPGQIMMLRERFTSEGYAVLSAMDGEEGFKVACDSLPDIILLDFVIPKIDGFEVCKKLKSNSKTRGIPVIVLTASGLSDLEERVTEAGAEAWFRRPFDSHELLNKVEELLK